MNIAVGAIPAQHLQQVKREGVSAKGTTSCCPLWIKVLLQAAGLCGICTQTALEAATGLKLCGSCTQRLSGSARRDIRVQRKLLCLCLHPSFMNCLHE